MKKSIFRLPPIWLKLGLYMQVDFPNNMRVLPFAINVTLTSNFEVKMSENLHFRVVFDHIRYNVDHIGMKLGTGMEFDTTGTMMLPSSSSDMTLTSNFTGHSRSNRHFSTDFDKIWYIRVFRVGDQHGNVAVPLR